jgi:hypothetical protein
VDAARSALADVVTRRALAGGTELSESARILRTVLADGIARRSVLFVLGMLGSTVEPLLWGAGDHRSAAVLGRYSRLHATAFVRETVVDAAVLGAEELAAIEAEAAGLDFDGAAALALEALDRVAAAD